MKKHSIRNSQEEFREFCLDIDQCSLIEEYLHDLCFYGGLSVKIYDPASYYLSKKAFGKPLVVCFNKEDRTLQVIGDSIAIGKMKSCIEEGLSESLERKVSLRTNRISKAIEGMKNMNIN
jgi:hypothetical protein